MSTGLLTVPMCYGPAQVVERRPAPRLAQPTPHGNARRVFSDEEIREIRFSYTMNPSRRCVEQLAGTYRVATRTIYDILARHSYASVVGLPLSQRYWRSSREQHLGLVLWLAWFLWMLRVNWQGRLSAVDLADRALHLTPPTTRRKDAA